MSYKINSNNFFSWELFKFCLIIVITFILITWYSFQDKSYKLFNYEIKKSDASGFFTPLNEFIGHCCLKFEFNTKNQIDTTNQRILIIGDSMLGFLRLRLNDYCKANKHEMYSVIWNSGNILSFSNSDTLDNYINKFKPTYIIIVLGSNDLFLRTPEVRIKEIKKIIKKIKKTPFIWVGPPNWEDDYGINNVIIDCVGRKRFFESRKLEFDRLKDGAHPTKESAYKWMDSIAKFIEQDAKHKIMMTFPKETYNKYPNGTIINNLN